MYFDLLNPENKSLVVLSGGMDSTTLLKDVRDTLHGGDPTKVWAISFDYNQKHRKELECAILTCRDLLVDHRIVPIPMLNDLAPSALTRKDWKVPTGHYEDETMKQTVVPNRNMVMISLAVSYAINLKVDYLFVGVHSGDHAIYPDCRPSFYSAMQDAIMRCDWHEILLRAPYLDIDKNKICKRGVDLNVDYGLTWTCYEGKYLACGKCGSCVERLEAFEYAGVSDPVKYE